jgi:microbial collagenase
MWGNAPIYQNGRMVWFDEGLAEFCTWGTTDSGIKPRRRLVELVQSDGPNRMTVSQVLSAVYGDEKFYRYSALLFGYFYQHDLATLLQLIDLVRAGNVGDYDAAVAQMKVDVSLQPAFGNYLDGLVSGIGALDDPSTIIPPLNGLDIATPADVQTHVRQTRIGYLAECSVAAVETNTRFSARGTLSGTVGGQQDLVVAWHLFDANLDEMIEALQQQGVNNFTALTGRFGKIRWVDLGGGQSYPMADYFVDGPLVHGTGALQLSLQQVTADFHSTRLGVYATGTQNIPTTVEMHVTLATVLYSNNVSSAVLLSELEDARTELRNQVYAIRPPYYRRFTVDWVGGMQTIQYPNQQVYGLRDAICQVCLP